MEWELQTGVVSKLLADHIKWPQLFLFSLTELLPSLAGLLSTTAFFSLPVSTPYIVHLMCKWTTLHFILFYALIWGHFHRTLSWTLWKSAGSVISWHPWASGKTKDGLGLLCHILQEGSDSLAKTQGYLRHKAGFIGAYCIVQRIYTLL